MKPWLPALLLFLAAAVPAAAQQPSVQQQFDAASAARDAGDWAGALRQFEALESRLTNPRTLAIVRVRKGGVLVELGRPAEAAAAIRMGLPGLPEDDANLAGDRFLALLTLGRVAEHDLDYPAALAFYRRAAAAPVPEGDRLIVWRGLIQTQLFTDAPGALRDADATLAAIERLAPANQQLLGQIHTLKGRALLNLGRFAEARTELETALRLLGNLSMRVDRADLLARSDLAIAALRAGDEEAARRYLAYTGAGHFDRGLFTLNPGWDPPRCGPEIAPDDVVVVEVYVGTDGSVGNVTPIYASRQGPGAILFARAVRDWSFERAVASHLPALFRSVVRLELRCVMSSWAADGGTMSLRRLGETLPAAVPVIERERDRPLSAIRAELDARHGAGGADTLALLIILARNPGVDHAETMTLLRRALPLAAGNDALLAGIAVSIASVQCAQDHAGGSDNCPYRQLLDLPEIAASPTAIRAIRLAGAGGNYYSGQYAEALQVAESVGATLAAGDPLHDQALEIEIAVHAARGETAAASALYDRLGPAPRACMLRPRRLGLTVSTADFPDEALRWGFEGWGSSELTVDAEGRVVGARTVVAYPPFVFSDTTSRVLRRTRYGRVFVPPSGGCVLDRQILQYRLPRN